MLGKDKKPSFQLLQASLKDGKGNFAYYAFDLLFEGGKDIRKLANIDRKERLAALLKGASPPILYSDHIIGKGEALLDAICRCRTLRVPYLPSFACFALPSIAVKVAALVRASAAM